MIQIYLVSLCILCLSLVYLLLSFISEDESKRNTAWISFNIWQAAFWIIVIISNLPGLSK